jgi:hypothetical protein
LSETFSIQQTAMPSLTLLASASLTWRRKYALAQNDSLRNQPLISTLGLQLLALLCRPTDINSNASGRLVDQARMILMERCGQPLSVEQLAEELGSAIPISDDCFASRQACRPLDDSAHPACRRLSGEHRQIDKGDRWAPGFSLCIPLLGPVRQLMGASPTDFRATKQQ